MKSISITLLLYFLFVRSVTAELPPGKKFISRPGKDNYETSKIREKMYFGRIETVEGKLYDNVKIVRVEDDGVHVVHSSGAGLIYFQNLPDSVLNEMGLPSKAQLAQDLVRKQRAKEEQKQIEEYERAKAEQERAKAEQERKQREDEALRRYDKEQAAKGLIKFRNKWMTSADIKKIESEERERAYNMEADELVMSKTMKNSSFKILQAMPNGALCVMVKHDPDLLRSFYSGELFLFLGATSKTLADDENYTADLYWAGTHTYTTAKGSEKTINSYSHKRDVAKIAVRLKFGLFDKQDQSEATDSSNSSVKDPIFADKELKGFGSGFIITKDGYLLTNYHVIKKAKQVKIKTEKGIHSASVILQDPDNDIALLKIDGEFSSVVFAPEKVAKLGQTVFTVGFPMPELQGFSPKVTKGVISSLNGIQDDVRMYQIDTAVQPGNSGGPLADENGNIVGVVVSRIDDALVVKTTGSIAQNVNYAVKKSYTMAFLDSQSDVSKQVKTAIDSKIVSFEEAVERIRKATVLVIVY